MEKEVTALARALGVVLPDHACGLSLTHNQHKNGYSSIENWIESDEAGYDLTEEEKQECIRTNEIWTLQWYPDTPIGSCDVSAPTLEGLLSKLVDVKADLTASEPRR